MEPTADQPAAVTLPDDVVRTPTGEAAAVVVRTSRGWTVLGAEDVDGLDLVEGMSLADLLAGELGATPEPDRAARRAARNGTPPPADEPPADPRDEEIAALRRTVGQLEHALAARVSIERAIGVLAERHGTTPREAFEQLRRRARSEGRPAQELATEVLTELNPPPAAVAGQRAVLSPVLAASGRVTVTGQTPARRVQRHGRRADGDAVPGVQS